MKLYYAKPSPYARRDRVLLRERGLVSRVDEIDTAPWDSPAELLAVSPTSKVPALVLDDGTTLTESALEAVAPLPPAPSYAHIVLGVGLGYLDFRVSSIDWRSGQPGLAQWCAAFAQRDAMRATAPD